MTLNFFFFWGGVWVTFLWVNDVVVYAIYFAGFYFHEFRESGSIREFNNTRKIYLQSRHMNATPGMRLVYAILVVQYTVHMQMSE